MLLGTLLLSACAAQTADSSGAGAAAPEATPAPAGGCNADRVQDMVGQSYSEALAENARKASGASVLRTIRPGQAVTMDYRQDRLNLELDAEDRIVRARCG